MISFSELLQLVISIDPTTTGNRAVGENEEYTILTKFGNSAAVDSDDLPEDKIRRAYIVRVSYSDDDPMVKEIEKQLEEKGVPFELEQGPNISGSLFSSTRTTENDTKLKHTFSCRVYDF